MRVRVIAMVCGAVPVRRVEASSLIGSRQLPFRSTSEASAYENGDGSLATQT
jgi:hypothetical protein